MGPVIDFRHTWTIGLLLLARSIGGADKDGSTLEDENKEAAAAPLGLKSSPGNDFQERESKALNEDLISKIEAAVLTGIQDTRSPVSLSRSPEASVRGFKWFGSNDKDKEKSSKKGGSGGSGDNTHRVYLTGEPATRYQYAGTGGSAVKSPPRLVVVRSKSSGSAYRPPPEIVLNGAGPTYHAHTNDGTIVFESTGGGSKGKGTYKGKGSDHMKGTHHMIKKGYDHYHDHTHEEENSGSKVTIVLADTHNHPAPSPVHSHVLYEDSHGHGHNTGHSHVTEDHSHDSGTSWIALDNGKGGYGWGWDKNDERGHVSSGGLGGNVIHHVLDHLESIDHNPNYNQGHYGSDHSHINSGVVGHGHGHALGTSHVHVPVVVGKKPSQSNHVHVNPVVVSKGHGHGHDLGHGHGLGHRHVVGKGKGYGHGYDLGHGHGYGIGHGHDYSYHDYEHDHLYGLEHHGKAFMKHIYYGAKKAFFGEKKDKGAISIGDIIHVTVQGGNVHSIGHPNTHTHVPVVHTVPAAHTHVPRLTIAATTTVPGFQSHTHIPSHIHATVVKKQPHTHIPSHVQTTVANYQPHTHIPSHVHKYIPGIIH